MNNIQDIINNLDFVNLGWQIFSTFIFMLSDVISGVVSAIILKNLDSQKMREGLLRKMLLIIIVLLGFIVEHSFKIPYVSKVICIYIIGMESISIMENITKAGVDLGKLGDLLKIKPEEDTLNLVIKKESEVDKNDSRLPKN